jgi:hypothetical protein
MICHLYLLGGVVAAGGTANEVAPLHEVKTNPTTTKKTQYMLFGLSYWLGELVRRHCAQRRRQNKLGRRTKTKKSSVYWRQDLAPNKLSY